MAAEQVTVQPAGAGVEEMVADKGYHSDAGWTRLGFGVTCRSRSGVGALMLDGFPIYDGRVGASMGYLVQR